MSFSPVSIGDILSPSCFFVVPKMDKEFLRKNPQAEKIMEMSQRWEQNEDDEEDLLEEEEMMKKGDVVAVRVRIKTKDLRHLTKRESKG